MKKKNCQLVCATVRREGGRDSNQSGNIKVVYRQKGSRLAVSLRVAGTIVSKGWQRTVFRARAKQTIRVPVDDQSCCRKANRLRIFRGDIKIEEVGCSKHRDLNDEVGLCQSACGRG
jgi:hypothetical protein